MGLASHAIVPAAVHELSNRSRRVLESDSGCLRVERLHGDSERIHLLTIHHWRLLLLLYILGLLHLVNSHVHLLVK